MKVTESRNKREARFTIVITYLYGTRVSYKPTITRRCGKTYRKPDSIGPRTIDWTANRTARKRLHMAYPDTITNARQPKCNCSEC